MHGWDFKRRKQRFCFQHIEDKDDCYVTFENQMIDICANRRSVTEKCRYQVYRWILCLSYPIKLSENKMNKGFRKRSTSIEMIIVQILFKFLNAVTDILFLVIEKILSALLSANDELDNEVEIIIRGYYVSTRGWRRSPRWRSTSYSIGSF